MPLINLSEIWKSEDIVWRERRKKKRRDGERETRAWEVRNGGPQWRTWCEEFYTHVSPGKEANVIQGSSFVPLTRPPPPSPVIPFYINLGFWIGRESYQSRSCSFTSLFVYFSKEQLLPLGSVILVKVAGSSHAHLPFFFLFCILMRLWLHLCQDS